MTEQQYIDVTDGCKLNAALSILCDIVAENSTILNCDEFRYARLKLIRLRDKFYDLTFVEENPNQK